MNKKEFTQRLKNKILSHPESGKLSAFIISNGKLHEEMKPIYKEIEQNIIKEFLLSQRQ